MSTKKYRTQLKGLIQLLLFQRLAIDIKIQLLLLGTNGISFDAAA